MIYDIATPRDTRQREMLRFIFAGVARKFDYDLAASFQTPCELRRKRNVRADPTRGVVFVKHLKFKIAQVEVAAVVYSITVANSPRRCIPIRIATIPSALGT